MSKHTPGPWYAGGDQVLSDTPIQGRSEQDNKSERAYYGGYLIAESITQSNRDRIIVCVNACEGISSKALESGVLKALIDVAKIASEGRGELAKILADSALAKAKGEKETSEGMQQ
jgi:hypothetical protein